MTIYLYNLDENLRIQFNMKLYLYNLDEILLI